MSANTETTGADRTKCKAWCGANLPRARMAHRSAADGRYYFGVGINDSLPGWCWPTCRDARLPPIAAPAAHIERRKGQRWRRQWRDMIEEVTLLDRSTWTQKPGWNVAPGVALHDACWTDPSLGNTMTLLPDAPPEPLTAKDVFGEIPPGSKFTNDTPVKFASVPPEPAKPACNDCSQFAKTGTHWFACLNAPKKSPPAHEAPKAAPEQFWFTDDEGEKIGPFATGLEADDASVAYGAWMRTQTGKPYAGPARLPRPQLAADWVEDCLGDVR